MKAFEALLKAGATCSNKLLKRIINLNHPQYNEILAYHYYTHPTIKKKVSPWINMKCINIQNFKDKFESNGHYLKENVKICAFNEEELCLMDKRLINNVKKYFVKEEEVHQQVNSSSELGKSELSKLALAIKKKVKVKKNDKVGIQDEIDTITLDAARIKLEFDKMKLHRTDYSEVIKNDLFDSIEKKTPELLGEFGTNVTNYLIFLLKGKYKMSTAIIDNLFGVIKDKRIKVSSTSIMTTLSNGIVRFKIFQKISKKIKYHMPYHFIGRYQSETKVYKKLSNIISFILSRANVEQTAFTKKYRNNIA